MKQTFRRSPLSRLREESASAYAVPKPKKGVPTKECPDCGRTMYLRANKRDHSSFWGCSGFPNDCRKTLPIEAP